MQMELNKSFIAKMTRIYGVIVIFANIVAILVPVIFFVPVMDTESNRIWQEFLDSTYISNLALVAAFLVPTFVCITYSMKIFRSDEKIVKNLAEIPSVFSLSSVIGWNLYYFVEIPFAIYAKITLGIHIKGILFSSWVFSLFSGMTAWTLSYLAIEILNRSVLLPKVFPEGHILKNDFSFRPRFKHLLTFCIMVCSVFPIILLVTSLITIQVNNHLPVQIDIIIISFFFILMALAVTNALSRIIINPLNELTDASKKIQNGDYKSKVSIVTADELGTLADSFNDMSDSLAEKEFMRDTFGKIVDPEVRDYLMKNEMLHNNALGGKTLQVTVLFCDIRNFTAMSEKMEAPAVVSFLNRYFTELGKCITNHHGIINKYIGDAIMAIFGAPVESKTHAQDAFLAALEMREALKKINEENASKYKTENLPEIHFGIGIHTGNVFAGTIGASNRMEYTVIGDTVNTASRIESLCKTYSTDLLISQSTVEQIETGIGNSPAVLPKTGIGNRPSISPQTAANTKSDESQKDESSSPALKLVDAAQIRGKTEKLNVYTFA